MLIDVDDAVSIGFLKKITPFDGHNEVEVGLVNMKYPQTVNFEVAWFLEYHCIDDDPPSLKNVSRLYTVIDDPQY